MIALSLRVGQWGGFAFHQRVVERIHPVLVFVLEGVVGLFKWRDAAIQPVNPAVVLEANLFAGEQLNRLADADEDRRRLLLFLRGNAIGVILQQQLAAGFVNGLKWTPLSRPKTRLP